MAIDFEYPPSMDELLYFTNRKLEDGTKILAYTEKKECPECGKANMGKPINEKTGRPKIRAKEYVCPKCDYEEPKIAHENTLMLTIQYTNPEQTKLKKTSVPYKRKSWKGIKSFVFENEFTGEKTGITKRMKAKKKKK